jgi:hypothetical protein
MKTVASPPTPIGAGLSARWKEADPCYDFVKAFREPQHELFPLNQGNISKIFDVSFYCFPFNIKLTLRIQTASWILVMVGTQGGRRLLLCYINLLCKSSEQFSRDTRRVPSQVLRRQILDARYSHYGRSQSRLQFLAFIIDFNDLIDTLILRDQ